MTAKRHSEFSAVLRLLREHGLLLQQDKTLPNVVGLVAGEMLSRSWWDHPRAHIIFRCLGSSVLRLHRPVAVFTI